MSEQATGDMRLARAHLRLGLYALARMELEAMVTAGGVQGELLADVAEARWRTGDQAGAGIAAQAYLEAGGEATVAAVIAAEAALADGRVADARRLAEAVRERGADLDAIFAGQRRSRIWRPVAEGTPAASARERSPADGAGQEASDLEANLAGTPDPHQLMAFAAATLRQDRGRAAIELAVVLRSEPSLAPAVLELLAGSDEQPPSRSAAALEVVRGDAYRLIGRPREAEQAYARAVAVLGEVGGGVG